MDIHGATALVTGASSGIGEATARRLLEAGAHVVIAARSMDKLEALREASGAADRVHCVRLDQQDPASIAEAAEQAQAWRGGVDILVNNAGISQRSRGLETSMEVTRSIMETNFFGVVELTKQLLPGMIERRRGYIVNISSVAGYVGTPMRTSYCASKHAMQGYFNALRAELDAGASGVGVSLVCPGFVRTNVSVNALQGDGSTFGSTDANIAKGVAPERVANVIHDVILHNRKEAYIGGKEVAAIYMQRLLPDVATAIIGRLAKKLGA